MDIKRAQEIFNDEDTIRVEYKGEPVWIEELDVANEMAHVQVGTSPVNVQTVNVAQLVEAE